MKVLNTDGWRLALAVVAGAVWASSFPLIGIAAFAWLAPGALLVLTSGAERGLAFRTAYLAGATHYAISLSWLRHIPFPAGAYSGWVALSLFLALFPAVWVLAARLAAHGLRLDPGTRFSPAQWAEHLVRTPWWRIQVWFVYCAAAWVAWEMVLARLFGGFPWNYLGASQYRQLPLIQIASVTGVYGVSFAVVWFSVALAVALLLLIRFPQRRAAWYGAVAVPGIAIFTAWIVGYGSIAGTPAANRRLTIALVQPSIPQTVIFDPSESANRFETLLDLTRQAVATGPDLVVWPEASLPGGLGPDNFARLVEVVREARVWMVFGGDDVEEDPDSPVPNAVRAYNGSYLIDPDGRVVASYRKRRLVMFGEYIPFGRWLPFLRRLAPIGDGFHAGEAPVLFPMDSLDVAASVLICFEDNFPQQAREHAVEEADFLLNLTNNAWFGESAAQWQHMANALFRAIETGLPLVRCSNNGISCWIDPKGRIHSHRMTHGLDVYRPGVEIAAMTWGPRQPTVYQRIGDTFGWLCVALAAALPTLHAGRRARRAR